MIKINKDGISIYSEEQVLDQESIEVQKIVNIPEGRVKLQMEEDDSYKLIENLDSAHSSCSLSTLLKSDIDKEIIIEFLLDKKKDQIQTILNKLKPIPEGFIQIETDHICTTKSKWIEDGKPLCERYGFKYQGEWAQIDITHSLLDKLGLEKEKDIVHPLYLNPQTLNKEITYGGITIENEEELFIAWPVSEKNVEEELIKRLEELEILRDKTERLETDLEKQVEEKKVLEGELNNLISECQLKEQENKELSDRIEILSQHQKNELVKLEEKNKKLKEKLNSTQQELFNLKGKIANNPTWEQFANWCANNIFLPSGKVRTEKKALYPNLANSDDFHNFTMSVYSLKNLPILDVRKDWHENIVKGDFVFGNPNTSGRFMGYVYYKEFGKIFDEWRKTLLISPCE